jgi:8-oxo-dGTP pyrophosphatase MutT (NUDIX family)
VIGHIRKNLQQHKPTDVHSSHDGRARAAVLVPILTDTPGLRILLTERAGGLSSHGGEVAFPGGKEDPADHSLEFTALRENEEELGISPEDVDVIGSLRPFISKYGLLVKPFVGIVCEGIQLRPNPDEVASVFEVPLAYFSTAIPIRIDDISRHGESDQIPAFEFDGHEIWGLTSIIVAEFVKVAVK